MKEYIVRYREKWNKNGQVFETTVTAKSVKEATEGARSDLLDIYVIVSVKWLR